MTQPAASFSAASPCTFLFVEETLRKRDHDKCAPSGTKRQSLNFHPESLGVREASRQHWETLKPLIQRIYIDEDRPYPYLAHLLRTEHGFETTKRQFSRKIIEWGFRKNVSSIERRDILQTLSDDKSYSTLGFKDPRLKPEKIKNWRKRYRDEADEQLCHDPLSHTSSSLERDTTMLPTAADNHTNLERIEDCESPGTLQSSPTVQSPATTRSATEPPSDDSWLINWSTVEVPRSPNLSRLFSALKIECTNPVPVLSFEPGYLPEVSRFISEPQIQDLFNDDNKVLNADDSQLYSLGQCKPALALPLVSTSKNPQIAQSLLQDFTSSVFFGCPASPMNELYVFSPAPSTGPVEVELTKSTVWGSLATQESDLETTLTKLKPQFGIDHPSVIATMENLCQTYYDRRKYAEAELLDRKLHKLCRKELGSEYLKTLDVQSRLIDSLVAQGKYYEARSLNRTLFSSLIRIGHHGTLRIAHTISNDALIAEDLGHTEEAEACIGRSYNYGLLIADPGTRELSTR